MVDHEVKVRETLHLYLKIPDYSHTPSHFYLVRELEGVGTDGKNGWGYEIQLGDYELVNLQTGPRHRWLIEQKATGEQLLKEAIEQKEQEGYIIAEISNLPPQWRQKMGLWVKPQ